MELWDLYDRNGNPMGRTVERGKRLRAGEHHLVVHVWIINSAGRVLIQRRSPRLRLMPNIWAATGGSAIAGEDSLTAVCRELKEELGLVIPAEEFEYAGRLIRRSSLCDVWFVRRDAAVPDLRLQKEEVADARWVTLDQLREMIADGRFHRYSESYFQLVLSEVEKRLKVSC